MGFDRWLQGLRFRVEDHARDGVGGEITRLFQEQGGMPAGDGPEDILVFLCGPVPQDRPDPRLEDALLCVQRMFTAMGEGRDGAVLVLNPTGAMEAMCRALSMDMCRWGVRVNALRYDLQAAGPLPYSPMPLDVANAALYLASPASLFVTGQVLRVDAGARLGGAYAG